MRRVRVPSRGTSFHAQVLPGFCQSIDWFGSMPTILNAVVSLILLAIGTQSPIFGLWYSGRIVFGQAAAEATRASGGNVRPLLTDQSSIFTPCGDLGGPTS